MSVDILHHPPDVGGFKLLEERHSAMPDLEASFSVRLFPEGFSIGKPLEKGKVAPPINEAMGLLYPYNRASESFLRALDGGWIPGDLLEEIQCIYANGCITCEVLDYCVNSSSTCDTGSIISSKSQVDLMPAVYKITLKPTMESIAKDVSSMVDETWTYKDFMEVESKILKINRPELHLDPKLTTNQTEKKALLHSGPKIFEQLRNKGAMVSRRLRWAAAAKTVVTAGGLVNSKKIAFQMAPEAARESSTMSADASTQFSLKPKAIGPLSSVAQFPLSPKLSPAVPEMTGVAAEKQPSLLGKRDGREFGVKPDIKKPNQDSPRHMDKGFGHKTEQEQGLKALSYENTLEAVKLENSDQQRLEDPTRIRDENGGFGMAGGQSQLHDPQLLYQKLTQQDVDNQSWQASGLVGDKDKQDELLQRRRLLMMQQQKLDGRVFQQPSVASDISRMAPGMVHNTASVVASDNPGLVSSSLKGQLQVVGAMAGGDQMLQGQQLSRRRTNSLPKNTSSIAGVASPGSTINSGGIANVNSPSTSSMPVTVKSEGLMVPAQRREPLDNFAVLLSVALRHRIQAKRPKLEIPPPSDSKKPAPLFHLLECALNTSSDEIKDPKGQRNMADSLVGGNVNARKTRFLQFQRQIIQGPHFRRVRVRLVMCERCRDAMVEAVVQFGDDQDDETLNSVPHHVLPTMANAHAADIFARQFCALLEKERFELVEDQVQPTLPRGSATTNAACATRPLPAGASTLGNGVGPLPSPRSLINPHMPAMGGVAGIPGMSSLQPSSPGALASNRMPPPGNVPNRQISGGYLSQGGMITSSKPLPLDVSASQLAAVQHPQQLQPPLHMQRAQMGMSPQLAQLNHNSAQQLSQQMGPSQGQLHHFLQQQRQQTQTTVLQQRKLMGMGGLGAMGNLGGVGIPSSGGNQGGLGNMMGVNAMNNVVGMSGINNVSASMGSISGLNNVGQLQGIVAMGQNPALNNLISRQGNLNAAHLAAYSSKAHLAQGRSPMGAANPTARDNLTGLNPSNQLHVSAGMPIMGQGMSRVGRGSLTPLQRTASVGGLSSPRVATSNMPTQGMYLNSPQQVSSQQQFNLQQLSPMQQTGQQQAIAAQQMQLTQPQQVNTQVQQQQPNPPQQLHLQQQPKNTQVLNPQTALLSQTQQQQPQPQQQQQQQQQQQLLNSQAQMNPASQQQNALGSLGSLVGGPASPQLSSQNMGSVTSAPTLEPSITNCSATSLSSG